jgi:hypothetical protein
MRRLRAGTTLTNTVPISLTLPAGGGRTKFPGLVIEPGRSEADQANFGRLGEHPAAAAENSGVGEMPL